MRLLIKIDNWTQYCNFSCVSNYTGAQKCKHYNSWVYCLLYYGIVLSSCTFERNHFAHLPELLSLWRFIWITCKKMTEFRTKFYLFVWMKLLHCLYIILLALGLVFHSFKAYFNTKTNVFLNLQPFPHYVSPDSQNQNLYTSVSSDCFILQYIP